MALTIKTQWPKFWAHVAIRESGCWEWTGALDENGYGRYGNNTELYSRLAHRLSYFYLVGPIPEGMYLDHLCRNRKCVNPDHLRPVTPRQSTLENSVNWAAKHAAQTYCTKGHPLSGDNLYLRPQGGRSCRTCVRERVRESSREYRLTHREELRRSALEYYHRRKEQEKNV